MKKKIGGVEAYIGINIILFALIYLKDPSISVTTLIDCGAPNGFTLADGQLWRLIMSMFLHASWEHLAFNCLSLYIFGRMVEHYYGTKRFVLISFVIGLIASLGSFLFDMTTSVGASGVIYGYIGFHLYLFLLNREGYKRYFGTDVFILLGLNIVYSIFRSNIDLAAHAFGLLGGLAVYLFLDKYRVDRTKKTLIALAFMLLVFFTGKNILQFKDTKDYYLTKIYYLDQKNETIQRDQVIAEYLGKYPQP